MGSAHAHHRRGQRQQHQRRTRRRGQRQRSRQRHQCAYRHDGHAAADERQHKVPPIFLVLLYQIHHIFLRLFPVVHLRHPFPGEQVVDRDVQHLAQRQHQGCLRQSLAALPFGDGLVTDGKAVRQLALGQVVFLSCLGNKFADSDLIHRFLLSAFIVPKTQSGRHTRGVGSARSTERRDKAAAVNCAVLP